MRKAEGLTREGTLPYGSNTELILSSTKVQLDGLLECE
jgi:hypothetical protein